MRLRRIAEMTEREADDQMRAHFDRRAAEYDGWWLGTGSFAERERPGWSAEVEQLIGVVRAMPPARVLDVACGTGFLTQHLRGELVALDQSARMVEIAAARMPHARVLQGDVAPLPFDDGEFDRVFTSHFFHHLSPGRRAAFIADARRVGRELVVVEDVRRADAPAEEWHERVLSDGSRQRMHRHFFTAAELITELGAGQVLHEGRWFVVVAAN
jgi:ubiquinone/menaquinone biosynthesis C-methylase UbiE